MAELGNLTVLGLLQNHAAIGEELRIRNVTRTSNNPLGDVAEYLFAEALGWELEGNSKAGYDAICPTRGKIQIKSRRITPTNGSFQAGAIRKLDERQFNFLAGVVFDQAFDVKFAMIIPHPLIVEAATNITHTNSSRIYLKPDWLSKNGVEDVSKQIRLAWSRINETAK